ncbi:MAG: DUF6263 family protein [Verrucomicrobiota bacterium]
MRWISVVIAFASCAAVNAEPLLSPRYEIGKQYITQHSQRTQIGEQEIDLSFKLYSICRNASGNADREVVSTMTQLKVELKLGEQTMSFDSERQSTGDSPIGASFGKLVGKSFAIQLDESGEVVGVSRIDAFADGAANPLGHHFGEETLQQLLMASIDLGVPADGVKKGGNWLHEVETPLAPDGHVRTAYRYRYETNETVDGVDCARIDGLGVLSISMKSGGGDEDPKDDIETDDGSVSGSIWMDQKLRFPRKSSANVRMNLTAPHPTKQGEQLRTPVVQKVEMKLISVR